MPIATTANMRSSRNVEKGNGKGATPHTGQRGRELQAFGSLIRVPLGLDQKACESSVQALNQLLADTMSLRDLYKKHHWQVTGPTFHSMHELFDKHYEQQSRLVDEIAERIQLLGGLSVAVAADVAEMTRVERPAKDREPLPVQISRMVEAHEQILQEARKAAEEAEEHHDLGTNDLLVSEVIRTNEFQVWYLSQHIVETPLVDMDEAEVEHGRRGSHDR
jgi:starvation-inducible DNA-binding protein